jgi:bifunctional non-homologous end joining protein LigD
MAWRLLTDAGPAATADPDWLWEVKWDGIRCVAVEQGARVRLWSRHQREMTAQFPEVVAGLGGRAEGRRHFRWRVDLPRP